jgi:hypothetical protein
VVALIAIAMAAPEIVALVGMGDLTVYLDLVVLSVVLAAARGFRTASLHLVAITKRYTARLGATPPRLARQGARVRRVRKPRPPKPSDDVAPSGAWAIA